VSLSVRKMRRRGRIRSMVEPLAYAELKDILNLHELHTDKFSKEKYCVYCEEDWPCTEYRLLEELMSAREVIGYISDRTKPGSIYMNGTHAFPNLSYASVSTIHNKIRQHYGEEPLDVAQNG
jgi:hypothetical protein